MQQIDSIARQFFDAAPQGRVPAHWADALSSEEGFRVQIAVQEIHDKLGDARIGWKVAATNPVVQKQLGISEPAFGSLRQSRLYAPGELRLSGLQKPHAECELCFELGEGIQVAETLEQVAQSVRKCYPAFEIIEKRVPISQFNAAMADNAEHTAIVLGAAVPSSAIADAGSVVCELRVNDLSVGSASGETVLGHPLNSILWLKRRLRHYEQALRPGMLIMTGSFLRQHPIQVGDRFSASFTGVGSVSFLATL